MMDRDQGHIQGHGHRLGKVHAHQQRPDQTGRIGHRYGVNVAAGDPGLLNGALSQNADDLRVGPGCNLRHHTAIDFMEIHLGKNLVGQDLPAVLHQGYGRLITGRFNRQNDHVFASFKYSVIRRASSLGFS